MLVSSLNSVLWDVSVCTDLHFLDAAFLINLWTYVLVLLQSVGFSFRIGTRIVLFFLFTHIVTQEVFIGKFLA